MGEGIAGLIAHELQVLAEVAGGDAVFAERAKQQTAAQEAGLDTRKRQLEAREERLRISVQQMRATEQQLKGFGAADPGGAPDLARTRRSSSKPIRRPKRP